MAIAARSCYEVLGIAQTASADEVKAAYAAILGEIRAGIAAGKGDPERLLEARAAFATLSDPARRASHDAALAKDARDTPDVPVGISPHAVPSPSPKRRNFFVRAWRGEVKAWKIFWFLVVPSWLFLGLMPLGLVSVAAVSGSELLSWPAMSMLALVLLLVLATGPVLLWRSAFNVSWRPLGYVARTCIVLLVLSNAALTADAYRRLSGAVAAAAAREPKDRELIVASQRGDLKKVKALIAGGADVKWEDTSPRVKGRTALHWAAGGTDYARNGQHLEVAKVLLAKGADVNAKAEGCYTPLHVAAGLGQAEMVRWLLDNGADVNAKDRRGTPLEAAALQGHEAVVAVLLERKPRLAGVLRVYDIMGTYHPSHTPILRRLLDAGADVNEVDDRGFAPIDYVARRSESTDAVLLLLSRGADLSAGRGAKAERLGVIVRAGHLKAVEQLFSKGLDPGTRGKNGETLMHHGVGAGEQMVELLHSKGVRHDLPDSKGDQPIHYAVHSVRQDSVQWLVRMKVPPDAEGAGSSTPLMECAKSAKSQLEIAKLLLASGASVAKRDAKGYAALDHAKSADMVVLLVRHGARVDGADALGYTALHRVVFEPPTRALLDAGAPVNARTKSGRTPLHTSVDSWNLVKLLLEKGADVAAADDDGMTPLHLAARGVNSSSIRELLAAGASVKVQDKDGRTPLHYAAAHEMFPVHGLVKAGADLNVRDRQGNTPLHFAARARNPRFAVAEMIKLGADPEARNADGKTAMQLAESAQAAIDRKFAKPVAAK